MEISENSEVTIKRNDQVLPLAAQCRHKQALSEFLLMSDSMNLYIYVCFFWVVVLFLFL